MCLSTATHEALDVLSGNAELSSYSGLTARLDRRAQGLQADVLQGLEDLIDHSGLLVE
jgi:hypothetical protein